MRTIRDLFPDVNVGQLSITPDQNTLGFENRAKNLYATDTNVADFNAAAAAVAAAVVKSPDKLLPGCTASDSKCGAKFVESFGLRAFRRPLTDDEKQRYTQFVTTQTAELDFNKAIQLVVEGMLQSANFLYRPELSGTANKGVVRSTGYEMASRLSYFIWGTMPDDKLFAAAKRGLQKDADVQAEAERMLGDDRARAQMRVRGVVAVGYGGIRALSRDGGKTWTKTGEVRQGGGDDGDLLRSVAFGNGMWVAGGWNKMWTSPDGATWTLRPHNYGIIQGLAFGNGVFIATTKDDDVFRSTDGLAWTALGSTSTGGHTRCIFGNGLFAASGNDLFTVTSTNGQNWQRANVKDSVAFCEGAFKSNQDCFGHDRSAGFWVPSLWARQRDLSSDGKFWNLVYDRRRTIWKIYSSGGCHRHKHAAVSRKRHHTTCSNA